MLSQIKSFKHQTEAEDQTWELEYAALLLEMGLGKSRVLLRTAQRLFDNGKITGLLIYAPKSICRTWAEDQIPTHMDCDNRIVIWGPETKKLDKDLQGLYKTIDKKLKILIVNIETAAGDRCFDEVDKFLHFHRTLMAVDESTTIKNWKAQRTKALCKLGRLAKFRRILTGTPITNSPLDLYSQFDFLKPGSLGSTNFYGFRTQYAVLRKRYINGKSFMEVTGYQRLQELQDKMKYISFRALKRDCLDLPEKIYQVRYVQMTPIQLKYYMQMRDDALALLKDGTLVAAPLVITQMLRLQQALCNLVPSGEPLKEIGVGNPVIDGKHVPQNPWREQKNIDEKNPRIDEIIDILQEAGDQKVIIWANFIKSIKDIAAAIEKEFKKPVGLIHGAVSAEERQQYVENFQTGSLQYMVAQPRTGGYGLTLTAATIVVYHDHNWSLEVRQQSEDRAHRIGQTKNVTYIDLVAAGTIDEKVRNALVSKKDLADVVTGDKLKALLED